MKNISGLQKICRKFGSIRIKGVDMVWDYANECAVSKSKMPAGSLRWQESERVKWAKVKEAMAK